MQCTTIKGYKGNVPIMGPKVKFNSLAKANIKLANINKDPKNHIKRVVYKCEECGFYHIGKTLEMLNRKAPKRKPFLLTGMKVVGQIDLSQFDHLSKEATEERKRLKKEKTQQDYARERRSSFNKTIAIDLREYRKAKIKKLQSTNSKVVGHFSTPYGTWMYFVKNKIIKVLTAEAMVKHVKLNDIFPDEMIESFNLYGDPIPTNKILFYMKTNQEKLHKKRS